MLGGLAQRLGHGADEALLTRGDAQSLDRFTVRLAQRAQRNHAETIGGVGKKDETASTGVAPRSDSRGELGNGGP